MHLEPTEESGRLLVQRGIRGPVSMLNLLRFRSEADYSLHPELAPTEPIGGSEAYDRYVQHTRPFLATAGGKLQFFGLGGFHLIGPPDERWDVVMLVEYPDIGAFLAMAGNEEYLAGIGHRTAALEDSRLLPIVQSALS